MSLAHPRVLLVEDHHDIAQITKQLLVSMGCEVDIAPSVAAAITEAQLHPFDLLVSDFGLPDGNGCDVLKGVSETGLKRAIVVTAYGSAVGERCRQAGFSRCMAKPVDLDELREAVARTLVS